jgi:glucose/arabinose dehydrogenase
MVLLILNHTNRDYNNSNENSDINSVYASATPPSLRDADLKVEIVTTGLSAPTSMAFIGSNDILVLEKNRGTILRVKDGVVLPQPLLDVNVATNSERGMLGIDVVQIPTPILLPSSRLFSVFLYYTEAELADGGTAIANRLYKYSFIDDPRLGPAQGRMFGPKLLLDLPVTPGPNHDGGKVVVGPGIIKNIYTVLGDLNRNTQAQNFENGPEADSTGGVLRVTQDGNTISSGIIGATHPLNKYFAYGIRNSFGIDFDPVSGRLWDTENGPGSNDEINLVDPGFNSGWEDLMGMAPTGFDFNNLVSFDGKGRYSDPEFVWRDTVAPTAIEFLSSNKLGAAYHNDMFVGDFNNGRIYNFNLNSERTELVLTGVLSDKVANTDSETQGIIFGEGFGGITDLKVGPSDGYLYVLSISRGTIYRILPN